jgi:hypothetical protein
MINPFFFSPWLIGGVAVALIAAGGLGYIKGYSSGVDSLSEKLTLCETNLSTIKGAQDELAKKNAATRKQSDRVSKDAGVEWDNRRAAGGNPVIYRVRDAACASGASAVRVPDATGKPDATAAQPAVDTPGTVALTGEELNTRLNAMELDAAQLAHLIAFIRRQDDTINNNQRE